MAIDQVIKRDGRCVPFDRKRIENAIYAAARAVGNGEGRQWAETLSWAVTGILEERFGQEGRVPHVEEIQDIVEEVLIKSGHPQVAKAYILYRQKRAEARAAEQMLLDTTKLVDDYLDQTDWRVSENSNMNYSLQGLNFYLASSIAARYWLHKIYPPEVQRAHIEGDFHIHDLGMLSSYTYYGKEVVILKDRRGLHLTSFEQAYAGCPEPEICLNEADGAFAKYPQDCFVLDKDGWTRVVRLVRKRKDRPMRFIKNRGGRSVIVTDNHPMITSNGERLAADVRPHTDALYTMDLRLLLSEENLFSETEIDLLSELQGAAISSIGRDLIYFNGVPISEIDIDQAGEGVIHTHTQTIPRRLRLTADFGYFVGFALAEGHLGYDTKASCTVSITQKDPDALHAINQALIALGMPGYIVRRSDAVYELQVKNVFLRFLFEHVFRVQPGARHKSLPVRILHYNTDFVQGMLAGVMDGDGSITGNGTSVAIRVSARTLLEQMACVLHLLGATPRDRNIEGVGTCRTYKGRAIVQRFPLYGLSFRKTAGLALPSSLFQSAAVSARAWQDETRNAWHAVLNNEPTEIPDGEIYDITTESGTLIVNGMWNHNCTGWDLQDLLIRGFGGVPAKIESRPPRHLRTALGQLVNFFYTVQGEVAGAVAVSNFDTLLAPFIRYDRLDEAGVKQAVQEFIFNINVPTRVGFQSLVWDELVVLRRNGRIEVIEIGRLVDEQFERNRHRVLNQGNHSYAVANADDIQALAFGPDGRTTWAPIKAFVRHRVPQGAAFLRVRTSRGTARVSQAHSLFAFGTLDGQFTPRPITAREVEVAHGNARITPTNHLIAVRRVPNEGTRESLDLVELIDAVPQIADRVRVRVPDQPQAVRHLQERVRRHFGGLTPFYLEYGIKDKGCWRRWSNPEGGALPYRIWRAFGDNEEEAEFSLRSSDLWYPRTLDGERLHEFVHLLAWYITEGHNGITNGWYVSQARGGDQEEMARVLGALGALGRTEKMRGWSAQGNPTCEAIRMAGKGLLAVLIGYLGGTYSTNKVIPWFVYDLAPALQEAFITTLFRGDAGEFPKYFDYTTTSKKLSLGLSLLLAMNGYKFSVYETSYDQEEWNDQYTLRVYKDKDAAERYAVGDLLARICLQRETFAYQGEYEYDLSVDMEMENFAGGSGLLCFHNTPFTNITMDLTPPPTLRDQPVIIGGKPQEAAYGEFQREMDLLNRTFAEVMLEGDARGRVFSVDYSASVPVRENGTVRLLPIGEYIDGKMAAASPERTPDNQAEVLDVQHLDIETIGIHNGQVGWHKVRYLVRHPADRLLKITTAGGFNVLVTPSHSILVLRNGEIVACEAGRLQPGEYLLSPRTLDTGQAFTSEISLAHEFAKRDPDGIYLHGARYKDGRPLRETRTSYGKKPYHYKVSVVPLAHVVDILDELDLSTAQLGLAGSDVLISNTIRVDEFLLEFLGYYVAEGSAAKGKSGGISLGFNLAEERNLAYRIAGWLSDTFSQARVRDIPKRNLVEVRVYSKLLRRIMLDVFGIANGVERRVPDLVFGVPDELKRAFLRGYFNGDATRKGNALFASTIAPGVAYGISTLLKQLGIAHTWTEYVRNGGRRIYRISLWDEKLAGHGHRTIGKMPIVASGLEALLEAIRDREPEYRDARNRRCRNSLGRIKARYGIRHQETTSLENARRIIADAERMGIPIPQSLRTLVNSNLLFLKVKSVSEQKATNGWVYDFCTEADSFLANQILVHNTFPIPTYNITCDFNWENPALEPVWGMTARYGIPYFGNYVNSDMHPEDARSMCCRLRLDNRELRRRPGGLFAAAPLTGSVGVVTINMPRLAYLSEGEEDFYRRLERLMEVARTSLEIKRKMLEHLTERGLYPYSRYYLEAIKRQSGAYWSNHFSTIGLIGMNEACLNLLGVDIAHPEGKALAIRTLNFMRQVLSRFQEETGNLYNLEATPAEGASYRLARADRKRYPNIRTAGTPETPYYTNSTHLPVSYSDDLFEVLEHQDELQTLYTGGTVLHIFLGERLHDGSQARRLVRRITENYRLPYFTITPTFSICPVHGYIPGEHYYCPYEHTEEELARYGVSIKFEI